MIDLLASLDDFEAATGREISDPVQAQQLLAQAASRVRGWCGWRIAPEATETFTFDARSADTLLLPTMRLAAVTSLTDDGETVTGYTFQTNGVIRVSPRRWFGQVVVEATHGYPDVPAAVVGVCVSIAARGMSIRPGVRTEQSGGLMVTYEPGGVTDDEAAALAPYRLPGLS